MNLSGSNSSFNNDVSPLDIIGENDIDELGENNIDFNKLIGERLLDLRENFNFTTAATCKISEFLMDILQIERRIFSEPIKTSMKKNPCTENDTSFETNEILSSESPFVQVCKKFCGEKALSNYFKAQNVYLEPVEKVVGFDHEKGKPDSVKHVPILSTLKVLWQHEDVLGHIYDQNHNNCQGNTMTNYSQGCLFRKNKLLATVPNCLEIILYHDDFGVSGP